MTHIHVSQDEETPEFWRVEETDQDEEVVSAIALFAGQDAEARAREYAQWRETRVRPAPDHREELVLRMAESHKRSS